VNATAVSALSIGARVTLLGTSVWTPFYFVNNTTTSTISVAMPQGAALSNVYVALALAATHLYIQGAWDDCFTLIGNSVNGYY